MLWVSLISTTIKQNVSISEVEILYWIRKSSVDNHFSIQEKKKILSCTSPKQKPECLL